MRSFIRRLRTSQPRYLPFTFGINPVYCRQNIYVTIITLLGNFVFGLLAHTSRPHNWSGLAAVARSESRWPFPGHWIVEGMADGWSAAGLESRRDREWLFHRFHRRLADCDNGR